MKTWIKILIILVVAGIIGGGVVYKFIYNKPHPDYEMEPASHKLSAEALFDAYLQNPDQAGDEYNGEMVEISGEFDKLEESDGILTVVFAFDEGMFGPEGVRVTMLEKFNDSIRGHSKAEEIRLKGFCSGYNGTDVVMENGSIVLDEPERWR